MEGIVSSEMFIPQPGLNLRIMKDDWKWKEGEKYRWRDAGKGHGHWHNGVWVQIK
jgi:hypothetical protein